MGCMSHRRKDVDIRPEQKWDYINLNDFKSTSCATPFAYGYLYFSLLMSVAVYAVDTFTAVSLLAFNKWSSEIEPSQLISFDVAKWIFSICIILSFVNLGFEHIRAQRIMKRGSVAECYLDNLAVRLESIRMGKGKGWKRFLVFAELTKSKKGAEYIALFTYFSFQSWMRVILCSGPRQVVNALTLISVYNAKIAATGTNVGNTLLDFFRKIGELASQNYQQALILSGMIFTVVIWIFSFLSLLLAVAFYLFFLLGYIPKSDNGLSGYCSRKINKRLLKIVSVKVNTAIAEQERRRIKAERKAALKAGEAPPTEVTATIPDVGGEDKLPNMPMIHRNDTMMTLPPYTSRPGTPGSIELGAMDQKRPIPTRSGTMATVSSNASSSRTFSTRAPLLNYAAEPGMGNNRSASPLPSLPTIPNVSRGSNGSFTPAPLMRTGTASSSRSFSNGAPPPLRQLTRTNTADSFHNGNMPAGGYTESPSTYLNEGQPSYSQTTRPPVGYGPNRPIHGPNESTSSSRYESYQEGYGGMTSPVPASRSYGNMGYPASSRGMLSPVRRATNPMPQRGPPPIQPFGSAYSVPQRNMTAPVALQPYHERQISNDSYSSSFYDSERGPSQQGYNNGPQQNYNNGWSRDVESQRGPTSGWY